MARANEAVHMVAERICVDADCDEAGVLVEFHTQPARSDPSLTDVTLRWRCRTHHAWQETYAHERGSTIIETEQVR